MYLTSVVRFFEIATNTHRLSTWVYTPLTGGGENMKELGPTEPLEVSEVRNWQQEATVFGPWNTQSKVVEKTSPVL